MTKRQINYTVANMFNGYDKDFVNELARLLILYGGIFRITTKVKNLLMFLAHVKAEVDVRKGKVLMRESMNYSEKRLKQVFKNFRKNPQLARKYGRNKYHKANQQMIANIAYANRLGNRGVQSGDGWLYRGVGVLQSTGRYTIKEDLKTIKKLTRIDVIDSETGEAFGGFLDSYTGGILIGMANWYNSAMYHAKTIDQSTRIINRYTDSYGKRRKLFAKAKRIFDKVA